MSYTPDLHSPNFLPNYIIAAISASIARSLVVPIEKIQLFLNSPSHEPKYKNIVDCIIKVSKEHGPSAFWQGNPYLIVSYFPHQALKFAFRDIFKHELYSNSHKSGTLRELFLINLTAGGAAGGTAALLTYPGGLARTRLFADASCKDLTIPRQYTNLSQCIKRTYKNKGINGLYEGFRIAFLGSIFYRMCYFGGYDTLKAVVAPDNSDISFVLRVCMGICVSILGSAAAYPFNMVRTKSVTTSGRKIVFEKNISSVIKKMYQTEGAKGFFKQFPVVATKPIILANALVLAIYDDLQGLFTDFMAKRKRTRNAWE